MLGTILTGNLTSSCPMADPENVLSVAFLQPQLLQWYSAYVSTNVRYYVPMLRPD